MSALLEAAPNNCRKTSLYFKCRSMNATLKTCGIKGNFLQIWVLCRSGSGLESLSSLPVKQCSKQCLFFHFLQQFSAWSLFIASGELLNQTLTRTFLREKGEPSVPENYFHNNFINSQGNLFFFCYFYHLFTMWIQNFWSDGRSFQEMLGISTLRIPHSTERWHWVLVCTHFSRNI